MALLHGRVHLVQTLQACCHAVTSATQCICQYVCLSSGCDHVSQGGRSASWHGFDFVGLAVPAVATAFVIDAACRMPGKLLLQLLYIRVEVKRVNCQHPVWRMKSEGFAKANTENDCCCFATHSDRIDYLNEE